MYRYLNDDGKIIVPLICAFYIFILNIKKIKVYLR